MSSEGRALRNPTGGRSLFSANGRLVYQRRSYTVSWEGGLFSLSAQCRAFEPYTSATARPVYGASWCASPVVVVAFGAASVVRVADNGNSVYFDVSRSGYAVNYAKWVKVESEFVFSSSVYMVDITIENIVVL